VMPTAVDAGSWVVGEFTPWNHSLVASLHRVFDPDVARAYGCGRTLLDVPRTLLRPIAWAVAGVGLILSLVVGARGRNDPAVRMGAFGLALVAAQLGHVQTWSHHLLSLAVLIPLLASTSSVSARMRWVTLSAVMLFALLFSVPGALVLVLPEGLADEQYRLVYQVGRVGLPTVAILLLWMTAFIRAWSRNHAPPPLLEHSC